MRRHITTIVVLVVSVCLTRIPYATTSLCKHDSVNFALALEEFNVQTHQPHPPGFIIYIGLAKFLNLFVPDVNKAFIVISILFACLSVVLIYLLGKEIFNYRCGLISALFLISSPVFWAYAELALSYIADAFGSLLIAYIAYKVIKGRSRGERPFAPTTALSISLGLLAGIRVYLLVFLLPIYLFALISMKSWKEVIKQVSILIIVCLCWFIPLLVLTGGFGSIINITQRHYASAIFPQFRVLKTIAYAISSSLWALGAIILGLIVSMKKLKLYVKKELFTFFTIWCGPALLFVFICFIGNSGQVLIFLPCLILLSSIFAYSPAHKPLWERIPILDNILCGLIILSNCLFFFLVRPLSMGEQLLGIKTDKIKNFANFWMLEYSNKGLREKEKMHQILDFVKQTFSPETTVLAVPDADTYQPYIPPRVVTYYLRDFMIIKVGRWDNIIPHHLIELPPKINTIIWLFDEYDLQKHLTNIDLPLKNAHGFHRYSRIIKPGS